VGRLHYLHVYSTEVLGHTPLRRRQLFIDYIKPQAAGAFFILLFPKIEP
jgi:hypothetical protein